MVAFFTYPRIWKDGRGLFTRMRSSWSPPHTAEWRTCPAHNLIPSSGPSLLVVAEESHCWAQGKSSACPTTPTVKMLRSKSLYAPIPEYRQPIASEVSVINISRLEWAIFIMVQSQHRMQTLLHWYLLMLCRWDSWWLEFCCWWRAQDYKAWRCHVLVCGWEHPRTERDYTRQSRWG